jgi:hypothetical protein
LAFEELQKYRMPSLLGVVSNYFWEGAATKISEKLNSVGFVSGTRLCHEHTMSASTNNFFFAKKNGPRKPEMFYITFDCYNLNQARTRHGPEHYLCTRPGPRARPVQTSSANRNHIAMAEWLT